MKSGSPVPHELTHSARRHQPAACPLDPPGPPLPICGGRPIMTVVAVTEPSLFLVPVTPMKAPTLSAEALEVVPPPGPGLVLKVVLVE